METKLGNKMADGVQILLNSNISGYKISKDFEELDQTSISRLRTKGYNISGMRFNTVENLYKAYLYYKGTGQFEEE